MLSPDYSMTHTIPSPGSVKQVKALLDGNDTAPAKRGTKTTAKPRRKVSAAGRARIAAAQKARWAKEKGK
jgi:hypothetical protein